MQCDLSNSVNDTLLVLFFFSHMVLSDILGVGEHTFLFSSLGTLTLRPRAGLGGETSATRPLSQGDNPGESSSGHLASDPANLID